MSTPHVLDELSAYIDGESRDPQAIARHLQSCPECARRHVELSKLTHHLRALPAPDVLPPFSAQIIARLEAADEAPGWRDQLHLQYAIPTAWAMAAILAIVGTAYVVIQQVDSPSTTPRVTEAPLPLTDPDPEVVARILDMGIWEAPFYEDESEGESESTDISIDVLIDVLAASAGEDVGVSWYDDDDLIMILDALAQEDVHVLDELAQDHWDEG